MVVFEQKYNEPAFYQKGIRDLTATLQQKNVSAVIVNSDFTKSEVLKYFPELSDRTHRTYLGCQREKPHRTENHLDLPENYVLYLGTLEKRKNTLGLIQAFEKFKEQGFADYKLILAGGNGFESEKIEDAIRVSKFSADIERLYYVSDAHIHELYTRAKVFLFPSFYEGFGIPVLEAMALDCPVITSSGGALQEICGKAALFAAAEDSSALAGHLVKLAQDSSLRGDLVKLGFNRSSAFSWEKCATETIAVYKKLLEK
jgi:glycosyltransferase involved in cell wall biosynthesis